MNYKVYGDDIRSENAARPYTMACKYLCDYIKNIKKSGRALDFGCGKLRYSESLVKKFDEVTFVDSKRQIERIQMVRGEKTTVSEYVVRNYKKSKSVSFEDIESVEDRYDFILCANVLSAIPCKLTINKVLSEIKRLLAKSGEALIVNQYKNSSFKKYENGLKYLYGYINKTSRGVFYYGFLKDDVVKNCVSKMDY